MIQGPRRMVLAGMCLAPLALGACREKNEDVGANEDLMREHGVIARLLLVYDELVRRMGYEATAPLDVVERAATLMRRFGEDYHERVEEQQVFPRFEKAGKQRELVAALRTQHDAGRRLTDLLVHARTADPARVQETLRGYVRMMRPHVAREDTVLFPAFRALVGGREIASLGEKFEALEHERLGKEGFEHTVSEVAEIEKQLGIDALTPFALP
jgi:hemerythrin-like domain-containing protein